MAALENIASKKVCGGAGGANTGKLGCLLSFGTPEHLIAIPRGFVIPKETDFNLTYITTQVQAGKFIPIIGAETFEDVSSEDSYNTNSSGVKRLNLQGLPEYKLTFEEGHEFYRQISKLRSYKSYDYLIGDDEGNWMAAKNSNGDYKGFTGGHLTPEMRKSKVKGGDSEMKSIIVQFTNRKEWDEDYDIFTAGNLGFATEDIKLVNGVNLSFVAIPANGDVSLSIKAVLAQDNNTPIEGLTAADFTVIENNVTLVVGTVVETAPGLYTVPAPPAYTTGNVLTLDLSADIILNNDILYRADLISETVVA